MTEELQHAIGRHEAQIDNLERDMGEVKIDVKAILAALSEARGGWKTIMIVAGVAGAMGALAAKLAGWANVIPFR